MKKLYLILLPLKSFYSKETYIDFGRNWKAKGILYLLCLISIIGLLLSFKLQAEFNKFYQTEGLNYLKQVPDIQVTNGVVHVSVEQPYYIRNIKQDSIFAIIDTTGSFQACGDIGAKIFIGKNQVLFVKENGVKQIVDINKNSNLLITKEILYRWGHFFQFAIIPIVFIFLTFLIFIWKMLVVVFYSTIGLLIAKILKVAVSFDSLLSIAALAITPAVILSAITMLTDLKIPHHNLLSFGLSVFYMIYGINSCKSADIIKKNVP